MAEPIEHFHFAPPPRSKPRPSDMFKTCSPDFNVSKKMSAAPSAGFFGFMITLLNFNAEEVNKDRLFARTSKRKRRVIFANKHILS
ncbi:hypothetical protein EVAR_18814_1 [Eumeta japonica]|uniref:Uncharacterized protein n=1 Tax=Eumeta variegata TaxID=151549 RepID=A0A4C1ULM3_EUMVA|nr:hypothetical protein EVAR_18814_1 [Eumeta japonica]